ncbi:hypothetical protein [Cutibacterium avidum]|uniref:hypothetical protein n=1 Tax=Cutibacterium avidum TaxID=33010 RepID=UPI00110EECF6|nr:hypothetical protein [Cutibacterium avidum]
MTTPKHPAKVSDPTDQQENNPARETRRRGAKTRSGKRCRLHGEMIPAARRNAAANVLEARINGELHRINIQPATNPARELARIVGEQIAILDALQEDQ